MKSLLPIIMLIAFAGCAKEEPTPPAQAAIPEWSRQVPQPISPNGITLQGSASIMLTWTPVADADRYTVDMRRINAQGDTIAAASYQSTDAQQSVSALQVPINTPMIWRVSSYKFMATPPNSSEWSAWATFVRVP
jgi:hypothetical protein